MLKLYHFLLKTYWRLYAENISKEVPTNKYAAKYHSTDQNKYLQQIPLTFHHIVKHKVCFIEPQMGWAIQGRTIIAESYAFWTNVKSGWPPLPSLIGYLNPFKKVRKVQKAVSFHYGWDNYYHFFIDTLPQIKHWQSLGLKNVVYIVPDKVKNIRFVQGYLALDPFLDEQQVVYQSKNEYFKITEEVHFLKRSRYGSVELKSCIDEIIHKLPSKKFEDSKRVFLIRKNYRSATNLDELIAIAEKHGFETQLAEGLSLKDQIYLFANTRWLIGFHGAGLTNMIFRINQAMSVLELFPENKIPLHYWHLTIDFGFNYSYLIGDAFTSVDENYFIEPDSFNKAIVRMLKEDPSLSL